MLELRPYQRESLDALYTYWQSAGGNALIVLPTGAGKSLVIAKLCQELLENWPALRVACVTHVRELISQNYQEMLRLWPQAPAGIYSAGIGRRDARAKILFCGIQSVWSKTKEIGQIDVVLIDEAHLVSKNSETMYGKFLSSLRDETPDLHVVGLTASPFRLDSGRLDRGKDRLFDKIVYEANVADLIDQQYLSPLTSKATAQQLDVTGVQKRGGEYIAGQLEVAVDKEWLTRAAAAEICRFGADRKAWLAFCAGVKHAEHVRDAIRANGVSCETVTGETDKRERDRLVAAFRAGKIKCLTSVGVLGTGFNVPQVSLIALLRPTQSAGLFLQQCGRGLRRADGKQDCLVLDFSGLTKLHGPIDQITSNSVEKRESVPGSPLAKECPHCATLVALAALRCPTCGYEWPPRQETPKHEAMAEASAAILSKGAPAWVAVDGVRYYLHQKEGSPPSLRAEYDCALSVHRSWLCFSHQGFARQKAESWWRRCGGGVVPRDTDEALRRVAELNQPIAIQIKPDGKYFSVVGWQFERQRSEAAA